ncbi:MAG: response regulator [Pseudomonadota bacterium]
MTGAKILLVDDEKEFLNVLSDRLAKRGFQVFSAGGGREALTMLRASPDFEVVALDFRMPGLDGVETLKLIKKEHPLLEVLILTGHSTVESGVEGIKHGAFDYLTKPCEIDDLAAKINQAAALKWKHENDLVSVRSSPPHARRQLAEKMDHAVKRALGFSDD